jgi:hypothetical protein
MQDNVRTLLNVSCIGFFYSSRLCKPMVERRTLNCASRLVHGEFGGLTVPDLMSGAEGTAAGKDLEF